MCPLQKDNYANNVCFLSGILHCIAPICGALATDKNLSVCMTFILFTVYSQNIIDNEVEIVVSDEETFTLMSMLSPEFTISIK